MAVTNDLSADRRVLRHADTLAEAGCRVTLIGRELPWSKPADTRHEVVRLRLKHLRGWRFYAEFNRRLASELRRLKPDIVWANDADTLPGCHAGRRKGAALVMDAHEMFPEVPELMHKPLVRWVWRTVERSLMPRCDALLTVCDSLADHYRQELGVSMEVVRNIGRRAPVDAEPPALPGSGPVLLYQGAVNLGRGVDWAIDAMEFLPECRLVVAGAGDLLGQMQSYAASKPWAGRITFLGQLTPTALAALTPLAAVGLVMLEDMGKSYHCALPNRVGDFVQAGVPMVVSDLPEMARVVRRYHVGEVMADSGAAALADAARRVLERQWHEADFDKARADFEWDKERKRLLAVLRLAASRRGLGPIDTDL